jgi:hypothetical protein
LEGGEDALNTPDHSGSSFDSFLEEVGTLDEAEAVATKRETERWLDIAARTNAEEGVRQGLEDASNGRVRPARQFFAEFEATHGMPAAADRTEPQGLKPERLRRLFGTTEVVP